MIAYKFLGPERVAPFTGFRWPSPNGDAGDWVEAEVVDACRGGIHACRVRDLPIWIASQLWEIELDGEVVELERKVVASRGRLLRRLPEWNDDLRDAFAEFCVDRTRLRVGAIPVISGFVADVERFRAERRTAIAGFAAARAAELRDGADAYEEERQVQAQWLAQRLGLGRAA